MVMAIIYLALGSNVGIGDEQFDNAITKLSKHLIDIEQAPRYHSKAVGFTDQPDFLNTALKAATNLSPTELLVFIQLVEQSVGRIKRFRWGPREIDIDIIFYEDRIIDKPELTIPHPRFSERDFVLKPINDLDPMFVDPVSHKTISELYLGLAGNNRSIKN